MKTINNSDSEQPVTQPAYSSPDAEETKTVSGQDSFTDEYDNYCPWEQ